MKCSYCGYEIDVGEDHFECNVNLEDYCDDDCCISHLREQEIVAMCENGRYHFQSEFYDEEDLVVEIGEWV